MSLAPGSHLQGFEIRRQLGAGGMGVVYLAHDLKLGRSVAIKVLPGELAGDPARTRRFEQEARAASALNHPNVCVVHALGETPDGHPFIAMEYVEGHTLRHLLHARPPGLRDALDIAIQIAAGVGAAHALGIVHRDLKPENVLVRDDGVVKVLDFGLAKLVAGGLSGDVNQATRTLVKTDAGVVMGTFTYMAPEQARGVEVDARADIWSLGVILYEMVAGRVPFAGDTRSDVLAAILEREPAPLDRLDPAVPHELQRIVAKALRKDRAQRYQTITDLRLDLEVLRGELQAAASELSAAPAVLTAPVATPAPVRRESSAEFILTGLGRHKLATAAALLTIAALALFLVRWAGRGSSPPQAAPARGAGRSGHLIRLTVGSGLQTDPTFSPDRRFIAYASDRGGNMDIWVQPVAGGDPAQVTKDAEPETQPAWSPDGSTIAFHSERDGGGIFAVPALGGSWRQIANFGERPMWSRDGKEVFFLSGPTIGVGEGAMRIYVVDAEGGAPRELAAPVIDHGSWKWIGAHPDGRISAAGTLEKQGVGFYTFTRAGDHLVKSDVSAVPELINQNQYDRFRFGWNRDGTRLLVEATVNSVQNLWQVDIDPATLAWRSAEHITTGAGEDVEAALSDDETRIAYTQRSTSLRLWSFPLDSARGRIEGDGQPFSDESGAAGAVDLTDDGTAAVYNLGRSGRSGQEIWVTRFGEGSQIVVPDGFDPKWAADGRRFVYVKWKPNAVSALMVHAPEGADRQLSGWTGARTLLPLGPADQRSMLVCASVADAAPLWSWRIDTLSDSPAKVLLDRPRLNVWQARLSPNGRWLAFIPEATGEPGAPQIALARADHTPITEWTRPLMTLPNSDKPRWSPDGRILYFLSRQKGFYNLGGIRFDPDRGVPIGGPFAVTHFNSPSLSVSPLLDRNDPGVSLHRAAVSMFSSRGSIWMLTIDK